MQECKKIILVSTTNECVCIKSSECKHIIYGRCCLDLHSRFLLTAKLLFTVNFYRGLLSPWVLSTSLSSISRVHTSGYRKPMDLHYWSGLSAITQEPLGQIGAFPYGKIPIPTLSSEEAQEPAWSISNCAISAGIIKDNVSFTRGTRPHIHS